MPNMLAPAPATAGAGNEGIGLVEAGGGGGIDTGIFCVPGCGWVVAVVVVVKSKAEENAEQSNFTSAT
jgi:hypothetical protein